MSGPLREWTDIGNPKKRRDYPFPEKLRKDCDKYYADNYIRWYGPNRVNTLKMKIFLLTFEYRYSTEPFASANGQIPQLNLWDDHDVSVPWRVCKFFKKQSTRAPLMGIFRSSMVSVHMLMILCVVLSFEVLGARQTNIIFSSNITSHHLFLPSRLVSLIWREICIF